MTAAVLLVLRWFGCAILSLQNVGKPTNAVVIVPAKISSKKIARAVEFQEGSTICRVHW